MASYPKIDRNCPLRDQRDRLAQGGYCNHCDRQVHNLDALRDDERIAFMRGCNGEVCVAYRLKTRIPTRRLVHTVTLAASVAAAGGLAVTASAQEEFCEVPEIVFVGGVKDASQVEWVDDDEALPELPVIVEVDAGDD